MAQIGLAKALELLREQLDIAQKEGEGHQFRFEITEADVELVVEFDAGGGVNAGLAIGVVSVGAAGQVSRADTHRLRLKLKVKDAARGGRNLEVNRAESGGWDE
jgi:hypothetical protein